MTNQTAFEGWACRLALGVLCMAGCPTGDTTTATDTTNEPTSTTTGTDSTSPTTTIATQTSTGDTSGTSDTSTTSTNSTTSTTATDTTNDTGTTNIGSTTTGDTGDTTDGTGTTDSTNGSGTTSGSSTGVGASCGDAMVDPGEECDAGPENADDGDCTLSCKLAVCGDGLLHDAGGGAEECDDGIGNGPGMACNEQCLLNVCGDGDKGPGEECDDGDLDAGDGCSASCILEGCGNNIVEPGEACDDGKDGDQDDGCTDLCQPPACGDGFVQAGEQCDDGDQADDDACLHTCKLAACGDGVLHVGVEECDDGNTKPGDLCSKTCQSTKIKQLATSDSHSCVLFETGRIRCWGQNSDGQLGYGDTVTYGDQPGELPTPDVPIGGKVVSVDVGYAHSCVLLDNARVRCFGGNNLGQLGLGNTQDIGDGPGEMPGPDAKLGADAITSVSSGLSHSCAIMATGHVRCWGHGYLGKLGYESENNVGDGPFELPPANLKLYNKFAVQLSAGVDHTCARFNDGAVLCWGSQALGQLGSGYAWGSGETTNTMPPDLTLTGPDLVLDVQAGYAHTCARYVGGVVRCWGHGDFGRLGYGNTTTIGKSFDQMPPPPVDVGGVVVQIVAGEWHTCALLDTGKVRCWGRGLVGELGYGNVEDIGDEPGEMPPPDVDLGGTAVQLSSRSGRATCALLTDNTVRCWGRYGGFAYGSLATIGDDEVPAAAGPVPF